MAGAAVAGMWQPALLLAVWLAAVQAGAAGAAPAPAPTPAPSPVESDISEDPPDLDLAVPEAPTRQSLVLSAAGTGGTYLLLYGWVTLAWYVRTSDSATFHFHEEGWFGRDTYAGGADKLGHVWGNYAVTRGTSQLLQYGGWPRRGSVLASGGLALAFFTFSEVKDGYKREYGFSPGDELCDVLGVVGGIVFELYPQLDRHLDFRISYLPSSAYMARLEHDGPFNSPEDYSGQTMLLAYHLGASDAVAERASWTRYVDVSIGYETRGYLPTIENAERSQSLFVGVSLNLQGVLDQVVRRRGVAGVTHFVTEMYQLPYTTLPLGQLERTSPPLMTTP